MNQKQLYPVSEAQARSITLSDPRLVAGCKDGVAALRYTALHSDYTQEDLAEKIGKAKKVLSRALNGSAGLPVDTYIKLMKESDSVFLLEYMCHQMGGEFRFVTEEEKQMQALEEQLAVLKSRTANTRTPLVANFR
jgi:transcriptional regulator with XRE-family HTH domain